MQTEVSRYKLSLFFISIVRTIFSFIGLVIVVRMILDFLKASQDALFVKWMNFVTDPLLRPFSGIFAPYVLEDGYVIRFDWMVAFAVYAFIGYVLVQIITILASHKSLFRKRIQ